MRLGIIGAGRVGASFVLAFPSAVEGILCSTAEHTQAQAARLHATAYTDGADLIRHCDVLLLTVRDDVLAPVSRELAASLKGERQLSDRCVFRGTAEGDLHGCRRGRTGPGSCRKHRPYLGKYAFFRAA